MDTICQEASFLTQTTISEKLALIQTLVNVIHKIQPDVIPTDYPAWKL